MCTLLTTINAYIYTSIKVHVRSCTFDRITVLLQMRVVITLWTEIHMRFLLLPVSRQPTLHTLQHPRPPDDYFL